jgi:hypothetical protein
MRLRCVHARDFVQRRLQRLHVRKRSTMVLHHADLRRAAVDLSSFAPELGRVHRQRRVLLPNDVW